MFVVDELLHSNSAKHDKARFAHEQNYKIQPRKCKSLDVTKTASASLLPGAREYTLTSDTNFGKGKQKIEKVKSLLRIYSMTINPTHEENGDVWRYVQFI